MILYTTLSSENGNHLIIQQYFAAIKNTILKRNNVRIIFRIDY
jgi:hypothetical protein